MGQNTTAVPKSTTANLFAPIQNTTNLDTSISRHQHNDGVMTTSKTKLYSTTAPELTASLPPLQASSENVATMLSEVVNQTETKATQPALSRELQAARRFLAMPIPSNDAISAHQYYQAAVSALGGLVANSRGNSSSEHFDAEAFGAAVSILNKLGSSSVGPGAFRELLRPIVINLLRRSVNLGLESTIAALESSLFLYDSYIPVLGPFHAWLQTRPANQATEFTHGILSLFAQPKHYKVWRDGRLVLDILERQSKEKHSNLASKIYTTFKSAGLFNDIKVPQEVEYNIRRAAIIAACAEGHNALFHQEMNTLSQQNPATVKSDFRLQAAMLTQQTIMGNWDRSFDSLRQLEEIEDTSSLLFQKYLRQLTDSFAKTHGPEELGRWIEYLTETYGMVPRHEWVSTVLDGYAHYQDLDGMAVWLQFCIEHGLKLNQAFIDCFSQSCRKYWAFGNDSVDILRQELLQAAKITKTHVRPDRNRGRKRVLRDRMQRLTDQGRCQQACEEFESALSTNPEIASSGCLELAVKAKLDTCDGDTEQVFSLLRQARECGMDTAGAVESFLLDEIQKAGNISGLIHHALQAGNQVTEKVFHEAVESLAANGKMEAALRLLKVATQQLGEGKSAYNEYSFGQFVFLYIGTGRYHELKQLVCDFTSETVYWHGFKRCKDSIKFGMRELTKRAMNADDKTHDEMLEVLEQALRHNAACHVKRAERAVVEMVVKQVRATEQMQGNKADGTTKPFPKSQGAREYKPVMMPAVSCEGRRTANIGA
ncbi:hypothetical protein NQ176_g10291 [Zarea fungicola]|uniref:Uncharacterized protein n=1 Tax=Zarea fungicola TaxID=93591 RepID=A0ACC1MGS3_9HYPO|nr:hypothetical protein NQ176_g10291 [Lecanicillium fungicola]